MEDPTDMDAPSMDGPSDDAYETDNEALDDDDDLLDEHSHPDEDEDDEPTQEEMTRERTTKKPRDYRHLRIKATPDLLSDATFASSYREIGHLAHWSLSSSKPGNGVDQLRDSSVETYWQSDGLQPHTINIQFPRRQTISALGIYLDYNLDESYTPKKMDVKVGTTFHNLEEVRVVEVREPVGWCVVPLWRKWGEDVLDSILDPDGGEDSDDDDDNGRKKHHVPVWKRKPLRTHFVQIGIMAMHQNGRDTHVRQVKVFGPREGEGGGVAGNGMGKYGFGSSCRGLVLSRSNVNRGNDGASGRATAAATEMRMGRNPANLPTFQSIGMSQFSSIR